MRFNDSWKKNFTIIILFIFGIVIYLIMLIGRINRDKEDIVYVMINHIADNFLISLFCATFLYSILYWLCKAIYRLVLIYKDYNISLQNIKDPDIRLERIQNLYADGVRNKSKLNNYEGLMFSAYFEKGQYEKALTYLFKQRKIVKRKETEALEIKVLKQNIFNLFPFFYFLIMTRVGSNNYGGTTLSVYSEREYHIATLSYLFNLREMIGLGEAEPLENEPLKLNIFNFVPLFYFSILMIIIELIKWEFFIGLKNKYRNISSAPDDAKFFYNAALCYIKANRPCEAEQYIAEFDELISNNSKDTCKDYKNLVFLNNLNHAELLIAKEKYNDAIHYLEKIKHYKQAKKIYTHIMLMEVKADIHRGSIAEAKGKLNKIIKKGKSPDMNEARRILESLN